MNKFVMTFMFVAALSLAACQTGGEKETWGAGLGALAGGLLGSQVGGGSGQLWATGAGVLIGSQIGKEVGSSLDKADQMYMQQTQTSAHNAPVGETITWNNPDSGHSGSVTPVRDGTSSAGAYCREYQTSVVIGGKQEQGYGTACQQPDGSWKVI